MKFNVVNDQEQECCQQRSGLCSVFIAFGSIRVSVGALGRALVQRYQSSAYALLRNVLAGLLVLVTVGGSVWAGQSGFLSPCHGGCGLGKIVVVPSPLGHLTSTRNLGVNPRFHLPPLSKKDSFLLF